MKVPVNYLSALALCKSKPEEIKIEASQIGETGKYKGIVKVLLSGEWQTVVDLDPLYDSADDATAALTKLVDKIKRTTPFVGQLWPVENGPIPFGFVIHAGLNGERILARPKEKKERGPRHTHSRK